MNTPPSQQPKLVQPSTTAAEATSPRNAEHPIDQQSLINRFMRVYQQLNTDNAQSDLLDSLYTSDIEFIDPLHKVRGLPALKNYCQHLYTNLNRADFEFYDHSYNEASGFIQWSLTFEHKHLNKAKPICVEGTSHLVFKNNKILRHQDYFDVGALLYEHIPVLGYCIQIIKHRIKTLS